MVLTFYAHKTYTRATIMQQTINEIMLYRMHRMSLNHVHSRLTTTMHHSIAHKQTHTVQWRWSGERTHNTTNELIQHVSQGLFKLLPMYILYEQRNPTKQQHGRYRIWSRTRLEWRAGGLTSRIGWVRGYLFIVILDIPIYIQVIQLRRRLWWREQERERERNADRMSEWEHRINR